MSNSPSFICVFADGEITRLTVWHAAERKTLDLMRAIRLACRAYRSRKHRDPPAIERAHFERDENILATYDASALTKAEA
jgi:hypothetical protein